MSGTSTLITLGLIGVGGYLFIKEVWPMLKDSLEDLDLGFSGRPPVDPPPSYFDEIPVRGYQPIIEDRFPDYVVEDRYPDYVIEDRYPDYYPYPVYTPPVYYPPPSYPPYCPPGRYWNGDRCKKIEIDCPPGFREDDGICKPRDRNCDRDEHWNGHRCEKCGRDEFWNGSRCQNIPHVPVPRPRDWPKSNKRKFNKLGTEEKIKELVSEAENKPETKRLEEITEKAKQSFLEVYYA